MDELDDGFCREIDSRDFAEDDAGNGALAERNEDDVAREELAVKRIGQSTAAFTVDFSWYYLKKHSIIIA